jgi:tetratricopeptide (TPR) repeat protein
MRRSIALSAILSFFITASAFAIGEARMTGKIIDAATKKPIPDATIHLEAVEGKTVKQDVKARKDGGYTVFLLDGTLRYKFVFSAPGYAPFEETMKLKLGEPNVRDIELQSAAAAAAASATVNVPMDAKGDPAVEAYNEGAALANAGDYKSAIAKFEAAVAAKPDLTAAWMALAKISAKDSQWQKAIDAAKKALEVDDEDTGMWTVLYQAYTATGDKPNALIAEKKLPANATALFNQAARLINDGKDAEAEAVLKQAVAVDDQYGTAWYELGMVYVRTGKNADARAAFNKYLELEPTGKDAATAKEMLSYIK